MSKCKLLIRFFIYFLSGVVILYLSLIVFNFYKFRNCHYIVNVYDGMGNQFYQYSFGHILAQETGRKVCYTYGETFHRKFHLFKKGERQKHEVLMLDKFNIKDDILLNDHFHIIAPKFLGFTRVKYFDNLFAFHKNEELVFRKNKTYFYRMYFSEKYFNKYRKDLLKLFELKVPLNEKNKEMLKEIKKHKNSVSIHIRRGDYLKSNNAGFNIVTIDNYYNKALKIFENMDDVHYFVFSNDIEWVKQNLKTNKPTTYVDINGETEGYFDFELMRNCKHNIIANSTFSTWAAYLNDNKDRVVVAPKNYHRSATDLNDFALTEWIRIDNKI